MALGSKSQTYLKDKILGVILYEGIESQAREEILSTICKDFFNLCSTANERVRADLRLGKLAYLGLEASDTIKEIGPLGDESHNNGHVALFITFRTSTGDKTIVYKPRSMLPEKLICDEKVGIMGHVGFGAYKVIDCDQDKFGEKYGYCEFLENDIIKNTIDSFKELQEYERKMCVLQKIAESLGISDLHCSNIITRNKEPCIIDAEAFLCPKGTPTGIFNEPSSAAYCFESNNKPTRNRLFFSEDFITEANSKISIFNDENKEKIPLIEGNKNKFQIEKTTLQKIGMDYPYISEELKSDLKILGINHLNTTPIHLIKEKINLILENLDNLGNNKQLEEKVKKCKIFETHGSLKKTVQALKNELKSLTSNLAFFRKIELNFNNDQTLQEKLESAKSNLSVENGRYILLDTLALKHVSTGCAPSQSQASGIQLFIDGVREELEIDGFTVDPRYQESLESGVKKDVEHNDLPIFYYNNKDQTLTYHDKAIGKLITV